VLTLLREGIRGNCRISFGINFCFSMQCGMQGKMQHVIWGSLKSGVCNKTIFL